MITTQRGALNISERAAALIDVRCRQFAILTLGYKASNRSDILNHIETGKAYLAQPGINLAHEIRTPPKTINELLRTIETIIVRGAKYIMFFTPLPL